MQEKSNLGLEGYIDRISAYRSKQKWYRPIAKRSAVAIIVRVPDTGPEMLMIKRADREGDPWSGHMAFPGGLTERSDDNTLVTAQRETLEEIGLPSAAYSRCHGRLSDILAGSHFGRRPMLVTPYLFTIEDCPPLQTNHEVAETLWVPLDYMADPSNRQKMQWQVKKVSFTLPCYFFEGKRIWGLSLMMIDELHKAMQIAVKS